MKTPLFSILVPVYNVEKYIDECLNSLVNQTFGDFEIILLDDGSTDNSGQICDMWQQKDDRIKVIHRENKGLFTTRLDEIEIACGEYIVFVDSDDYISKNTLEFLYGYIDGNDYDVVTYGRHIVKGDSTTRRIELNVYEDSKVFSVKERDVLLKRMFYNNDLISIWSKCVKKKLLLDNMSGLRRFEGVNFGEDKIFTAAILSNVNKMVYTDEPLYFYRSNGEGMSSISRPKYFADTIIVREAIKYFIENCECEHKKLVVKSFWRREWYSAVYLLKEYLRLGFDKSSYKKVYDLTVQCVKHYKTCDLKYSLLLFLIKPKFYSFVKKIIRTIWPIQ